MYPIEPQSLYDGTCDYHCRAPASLVCSISDYAFSTFIRGVAPECGGRFMPDDTFFSLLDMNASFLMGAMVVGQEALTYQREESVHRECCSMRRDGGFWEMSCRMKVLMWSCLLKLWPNNSPLHVLQHFYHTGLKGDFQNYQSHTWVYHADTGTFEPYRDIPAPMANFCATKVGPGRH